MKKDCIFDFHGSEEEPNVAVQNSLRLAKNSISYDILRYIIFAKLCALVGLLIGLAWFGIPLIIWEY